MSSIRKCRVSFLAAWLMGSMLTQVVRPVSASQADEDAWSLVPQNAFAAVVVPSIKRANADLISMFEGMDRASALLGPNPMEMLLLNAGLTGALLEEGTAAIVLMAPDEPVFVLPVHDAQAWIAENFSPASDTADEVRTLKRDESRSLHVRAAGEHVLLARTKVVADAYAAAERGLYTVITARLPQSALAAAVQGDVIIYASPGAVRQFAQQAVLPRERFPAQPDPAVNAGESDPDLSELFALDDDAITLVGLNFDPLGLGVRTVTAFSEGSMSARLSRGGPRHAQGLGSLPGHPFFLAGSIDVQGLGGSTVLERLSGGIMPLPEWLGTTSSVQFVSSPSVLGIQGGLLNETALVIATERPEELRQFIEREVRGLPRDGERVVREPLWDANAKEFDGFTVDSFEVKHRWPSDEPTGPMVESLLFGRRGIHGYVGEAGKNIVITMSQRRDVYVRTVKAALGEGRSLGENAMIRSMREWLPADSDIEVFLGVGQFGQVLQQIRQMIPMENVPIPVIDPKTKPVGLALSVDGGRIETGAVIPADVLSMVVDQALTLWQQFSGTGLGVPGR